MARVTRWPAAISLPRNAVKLCSFPHQLSIREDLLKYVRRIDKSSVLVPYIRRLLIQRMSCAASDSLKAPTVKNVMAFCTLTEIVFNVSYFLLFRSIDDPIKVTGDLKLGATWNNIVESKKPSLL